MASWLNLVAPLVIAVIAPSTAPPEFCGITGDSAREIAANVLKSRRYRKSTSNTRYVVYFDKATMMTLTVTTEANKAHPAAICRHYYQANGSWRVSTEVKCTADQSICKAMRAAIAAVDGQTKLKFEKRIP